MSKAYRINPNTVQKAVTVLKQDGLIEIHPGIGARVCAAPKASLEARAQVLGPDVGSRPPCETAPAQPERTAEGGR